jgi:anthranilate phosphoribosyltransferase
MKTVLEQIFAGQTLSAADAENVLVRILSGEVAPEVTGALLAGLRLRGENAIEIAGFARALRRHMQPIKTGHELTLDTCGTGGDGANTFNVSTAVGLLVASLGIKVVKHGNRAVSSQCGSADVLEALGIPLQQTAEGVLEALKLTHFGFCFAPAFHPVLKSVAPIRKNLGVRTVFNLLGPLCNPAEVSHQLLGVYDIKLTPVMADVLNQLGVKEAMVVSSYDGLDELSLAGPTRVSHLKNGQVKTFDLNPEEAGLERQPLVGISGGSSEQNAALLLEIFKGQPGLARNLVCYNAAAALLVAGVAEDLRQGVALAGEALDSGKVLNLIETLRAQTCPF